MIGAAPAEVPIGLATIARLEAMALGILALVAGPGYPILGLIQAESLFSAALAGGAVE